MDPICKYYITMFEDEDRCLRGVPYAAVRDDAQVGALRWPCWNPAVACPLRDGEPETLRVRFVSLAQEVTA